ncbi:protein SLOW WALKER 2 [Aristolochia californica]|uniref:protein SLOW WALKER 2 n=1 Tax=Aristolochia californica TaxID=171875 RepID=UPI0035DC0878
MSSLLAANKVTMIAPKTKKQQVPVDIEALKSDVASFASSIGLASASSGGSGFNDSDFRKTGFLKPQKPSRPQNDLHSTSPDSKGNKANFRKEQFQKREDNSRPRMSSAPQFVDRGKKFEPKYNDVKNLPKLPLMKASALSGQWYTDALELEINVLGGEGKRIEPKDLEEVKRLVSEKKKLAEKLMEQYSRDYEVSRGKSGDMRMLATAQRSGTAADKVAAFACTVEDNPIANLKSLDALLAMVTSKVGKRHALTGFEALRDLFMLRLLPDRKLKSLLQRPLNHLPESKDGYSLLLFWYWEECLKLRYELFVCALEEASRDTLPILKDKSLKTIYALLKSKSEQERRLLSALVNKLGDPERKTASGAVYHLTCLLSAHPNMKAVVIEEVDSFLFRPHLGLRAKYHAVNFLSQILLSRKGDGPKVAKRLVDVYFALFKVLVTESGNSQEVDKKPGKEDKNSAIFLQKSKEGNNVESDVEMDSRILSALLTGVNRAFPYIPNDEADDVIEVQTTILFKLVHSRNFNVGVQALMLLFQISTKNKIASDRFYRALFSKLLVPAVMNSSKAEMFLGLLFRAMKSDVNIKRISAFCKRLLQIALQQPPHYTCGCLFILSEVLKARPPLWGLMLQNESVDDELEHFEDIIEDTQNVPDTAPSSKLEYSVGTAGANFVATSNDNNLSDSDDSEDLPVSDSDDDKSSEGEDNFIVNVPLNGGKLEKTTNGEREQAQVPNIGSLLQGGYDPRHREPSYCNADRTSWWELTVLASHVHPSVATMARTLLSGANIVYNGDPLKDLSLGAFLDKFMEKKPKLNRRAEGTWHGGSQIAPARKLDMNKHLIGAEILSLAEEDVPPEDLVFHKFYMNKMSSSKPKKKKKKQSGDEAADELFGEDGSDESDDQIEAFSPSRDSPLASDGEYDYDDLDEVEKEADEDLLGDGSETDLDSPNEEFDDIDDGELHGNADIVDEGGIHDDDGDSDNEDISHDRDGDGEGSDDDMETYNKNKKRKLLGRSKKSPFASLEDYDHLLKNVDDSHESVNEVKKLKTDSKRRSQNKKKHKRG